MAVRNLNEIINTNTFGQWIERTNEIIQSLDQVVTMGTDAVANNNSEVYIQGNISTEGSIITDQILPLDNATDEVFIDANLTRVNLLELKVPEAGNNSAIQFTTNPALESANTWRIGPTAQHGSLDIAGRNFVSDSEIYDAILNITRASAPGQGETDPTPGVIPGTNLVIDAELLPAELNFSNANSATQWKTARTVTFEDQLGGSSTDVTGTFTLDGTNNISVALQVVNDSHTHDNRYFTQTYIENNYATLTTSNDTFVKVAPTDASDRSEVTGTGFVMTEDMPISFGDSDEVEMQYDGTTFEVRQSNGSQVYSVPNNVLFKQFAANGSDTTQVKISLADGSITAEGDITAFGTASDIRLKENIEPIENALDKVSQINGITFNYIDKPDERVPGLIAQELQEVLPEAVYESDDKLAIRYGNTIALLVEAIKELKAEVETLKAGG